MYHTFNGEIGTERIWVADIPGTRDKYLALFNLSEAERAVKFLLELENMRGLYHVQNLWTGTDEGVVEGAFSAALVPHGSGLYRLSPVKAQ